MAAAASLALVFIMLVTFVDVVGRYFFNAPVTFAVELTELGMGLVVLLGLAHTTFHRGHISVDVLNSILPKMVNAVLARVAALLGLVFVGLVTWRLGDKAFQFADDGLATQVLFVPVYPVVFIMSVAAAVAAVIGLYMLITNRAADESPS